MPVLLRQRPLPDFTGNRRIQLNLRYCFPYVACAVRRQAHG
ncbi:hypothetical protein [Erwinia tracheiphila]|nr:hypothetical protein [Erwinia tracheiphila]